MFSPDLKKLIRDAIALNVQLRDRLASPFDSIISNHVDLTRQRMRVQHARDYQTVFIGCGQRVGKTTAILELASEKDTVFVANSEAAKRLQPETKAKVCVLYETPDLTFVPQTVYVDIAFVGKHLESVYYATAYNLNQTWVVLL